MCGAEIKKLIVYQNVWEDKILIYHYVLNSFFEDSVVLTQRNGDNFKVGTIFD